MATFWRPYISERAPTKGQRAAFGIKYPMMNHTHRSTPPISLYIEGRTAPNRNNGICEPTHRNDMQVNVRNKRAFICKVFVSRWQRHFTRSTYLFMNDWCFAPCLRQVQSLLRLIGRGARLNALLLSGVIFLQVARPVSWPHGVKHVMG